MIPPTHLWLPRYGGNPITLTARIVNVERDIPVMKFKSPLVALPAAVVMPYNHLLPQGQTIQLDPKTNTEVAG